MIWKGIKETVFRYEASEIGEIRLVGSLKPRKLYTYNGYKELRIPIMKNGVLKEMTAGVHQLVCSAFHENPLNKPCVRHLDCDSLNNAASNLQWGTHKENYEDGRRMGKYGQPAQPYIKRECELGMKAIIDIDTGEIYKSIHHIPNLKLKPLQLRKRLNGQRKNNTSFRYVNQDYHTRKNILLSSKKNV